MRRKIEAVFFDLDGSTLVEGTLSKSFRSLVNHKKDIGWIFTTGRNITSIRNMNLHIDFNAETPHIFDSGALITNFRGDIIAAHTLNPEDQETTLNYLKNIHRSGLQFNYIFAGIYPNTAHVWCPNSMLLKNFRNIYIHKSYDSFREAIQSLSILKISVNPTETAVLDFPNSLNVEQQKNSYDILHPESSKGNSINAVRNILQISAHQMAFVCDDRNDISALRHPELSDMLVIQVGDKIREERYDMRVESPEEVGTILSKVL